MPASARRRRGLASSPRRSSSWRPPWAGPARQHCGVRASGRVRTRSPRPRFSTAASPPPACHPTACSLPVQVAGPAPGPTLRRDSCLACLASPAFPMPANSPPPPPHHAAGWAPGTGGPVPLGLETVLGSVRHILSSSCPQQAGKPDGVPPALPTTTATAPRGSLTTTSQEKGYWQRLPCFSGAGERAFRAPALGLVYQLVRYQGDNKGCQALSTASLLAAGLPQKWDSLLRASMSLFFSFSHR